jgi:protein TonB
MGSARLARCAERRWGWAIATSLLLHAAVAGAAWGWRGNWDVYLLDPQAGRASITLIASFASQPESPAVEVEVAAAPEESVEPSERREEQIAQTQNAITRDEADEPEELLRLLAPTEPVIVVEEDAATPVVVGGPLPRNRASREPPPLVAESAAENLPARRHFEIESPRASPAAVPAVSSIAASGVESDDPPQAVVNPPPVYPPDALAAGRTGRVIVRAVIAPDGSVIEARLQQSSRFTSLDRAAISAVRQWQFSPAPDPTAPSRRVDVPIDFVIRRAVVADKP